MKKSQQIFFVLISIAFISVNPFVLRASGDIKPDAKVHQFPADTVDKVMFSGVVKILNKEISGIVLLKKVECHHYLIHFSSEIGLTYFDIRIKNDTVTPINFFEQFHPSLVKEIAYSFLLWLTDYKSDIVEKKNGFFIKFTNGNIRYHCKFDERGNIRKKKIKLNRRKRIIFYSEYVDHMPGLVQIKARGLFKPDITLRPLKINH